MRDKPDSETIAETLKEIRCGDSQAKAGRRLGWSPGVWGHLEQGRTALSVEKAEWIVTVFKPSDALAARLISAARREGQRKLMASLARREGNV